MIKLTKKRQKILDVVLKNPLITAGEISLLLKDINFVTIYRNLDLFVDVGIIRRVQGNNGEGMFEYINDNHHHAICSSCEKIVHIKIDKEKILGIKGLEHFNKNNLEVIIRGNCKV